MTRQTWVVESFRAAFADRNVQKNAVKIIYDWMLPSSTLEKLTEVADALSAQNRHSSLDYLEELLGTPDHYRAVKSLTHLRQILKDGGDETLHALYFQILKTAESIPYLHIDVYDLKKNEAEALLLNPGIVDGQYDSDLIAERARG